MKKQLSVIITILIAMTSSGFAISLNSGGSSESLFSEECRSISPRSVAKMNVNQTVLVVDENYLLNFADLYELKRFQNSIQELGYLTDYQSIAESGIQHMKRSGFGQYARMHDLIKRQKVGKVSSMSRNMNHLFELHLRNVRGCGFVEFAVHTFENNNGKKVFIYQTSGESTVGNNPAVEREREKLKQSGFQLVNHFHSHPFFHQELGDGNGGEFIPSGGNDSADVGYYKDLHRQYGLKEFSIGNGFEMATYTLAEIIFYFGRF